MKAKITKISESNSKYGGIFYYIFFKDLEGASFKTCVYPKYRNFVRWGYLIEKYYAGSDEIWLDDLRLKLGRLVDADSLFKVMEVSNALV